MKEWRAIDLASIQGVATINGQKVGEGHGRDAMGHPFEAVAWVANNLARRGKQLRAGHLVITGSLVTSKFPKAGDTVGFDLGPLGGIELNVT